MFTNIMNTKHFNIKQPGMQVVAPIAQLCVAIKHAVLLFINNTTLSNIRNIFSRYSYNKISYNKLL